MLSWNEYCSELALSVDNIETVENVCSVGSHAICELAASKKSKMTMPNAEFGLPAPD